MGLHILAFLSIAIFLISLGVLLFELTLTRIFSIVLWYDYAFMAISVAFFGLGIGSFMVHIGKSSLHRLSHQDRQNVLTSKIIQSAMLFALSLPVFVAVVGHLPSDTSFIYLYYLASSIPFFFAGVAMALVFLAVPKEINKLYFIDLAGAASATLLLNPLLEGLGAESVLILVSMAVIGPITLAYLILMKRPQSENYPAFPHQAPSMIRKVSISAASITLGCALLLLINVIFLPFLAIPPGLTKGLHQQLENPSVEHVNTRWNAFSKVDVTRPNYNTDSEHGKPIEAATIFIDADAVTPVLKWNGSRSDISWIRGYMDYLPYALQQGHTESILVIGGGGGEDILVGLGGGAKNVTAVELNPLVVAATREFGSYSGHLYDRSDVNLFIDDGRRFISSTDSKYDIITIKLVDSWAAQLAGAYALTENYLYTVEAFSQYFAHLNGDDGMLVMVRWNTELPRLIPLVIESLRQSGRSDQQISEQLAVVEDKPGLYFGSDPSHTLYPVLVIVKNSAFTESQVDTVRRIAEQNDAEVTFLPHSYVKSPYDRLLPDMTHASSIDSASIQQAGASSVPAVSLMGPPSDDSPFYFAKEPVPKQMMTLMITVLTISAILTILLAAYSRRKPNKQKHATSKFYVVFAALIGLGFMFLEVTFTQKFLLLLGTPIMSLTVILFSILISTGIGAYLSGRIFSRTPHKIVFVSIPVLTGILLFYFVSLGGILYSSVPMPLGERILLTFALLSPVGILMGFQFPTIVKMSAIDSQNVGASDDNDTTLLWGVTIIASIIGTVFAATLAMIIGFNGNILIGVGFYLGALLAMGLALISKTRLQRLTARLRKP